MTHREITRKLRRLGCEFDRQGGSDHEIWINPSNRRRTTVPNWGSKNLTVGTVRGIVRDLGLERDAFEKA